MPPSRREFLQQLAAASALSATGRGQAASPAFDYPIGAPLPFAHGVASGDPLADRVIVWTRITEVTPSASQIPVRWFVARDPAMQQIVRSGVQATIADRDWTVKVDVTGLSPATTYYYRFEALGAVSMTGRTRTAPASMVDELRFAVVSCSSYWSSWWSGYGHIADRNDLDLVIHCGDYLYDFVDEDEEVRARNNVRDTADVDYRDWLNIAELRRRHALWRSDPNLLRAHQQHPWFIVWDNHDIDEDYGNELATPFDGAQSSTTLAITTRVFHEWTPTRPPKADGSGAFDLVDDGRYPAPADPTLIYRRLPYGPLADVFGIDSQIGLPSHGRQPDATHLGNGAPSLLGRQQFEWLTGAMQDSARAGTVWRLVNNQTWIAPVGVPPVIDGVNLPNPLNVSRWSDYPAERAALFSHLRGANPAGLRVDNNVFVSGDVHGNWASDLIEDNSLIGSRYVSALPAPNLRRGSTPLNFPAGFGRIGTGNVGRLNLREASVGVEFAPSSMGRGGADELLANALRLPAGSPATVVGTRAIEAAIIAANKNCQFIEWVDHGYGIVSLNPERAIFEWWWQDKLTPGSPDVLGRQMIAWAEDRPGIRPRYRNQIDNVTAHGLAIAATVGTRAAAPAPSAVLVAR